MEEGKGCVEQAEQAKAFPGHGVSGQETQRICLYCAQKLVLHHWLVPLSLCPVVRTKFPNRVIYRAHRRFIGQSRPFSSPPEKPINRRRGGHIAATTAFCTQKIVQ